MRVLLKKMIGSRSTVVAMALASVLAMVGCASSNSSTPGGNGTATPTFSQGAGTYNVSQTVTIADTTQGAVLYCTVDGTTPTASSPQCAQPTIVFQSESLQAIAVAPGKSPSAVATAGYTINPQASPTPTFSPAGGTYTGAQQVTISDTLSGANIYYTVDGTVPTANSKLYTGPVTIQKGTTTATTTLSAIAIATGYANSSVASAAYIINAGTTSPVITPAGGTFSAAQTVAIADTTPGATIYYTIDGSTPTASSMTYAGPIAVSATETIKAIAVASGNSSPVATAAFTINLPSAVAPTFNPGGGTFTSAQNVFVASTTPGATIYYTVDGSMPTTSSSLYNGTAINVGGTETIKAIATATGFAPSAVSSATYTINVTVPPPTFSVAGGTYTTAQSVALSDTNASALIYYTTDGSAPTTSSTKYGGAISVGSGTTTINAIAALGSDISTVATATYTVNLSPSFSGKVISAAPCPSLVPQ